MFNIETENDLITLNGYLADNAFVTGYFLVFLIPCFFFI